MPGTHRQISTHGTAPIRARRTLGLCQHHRGAHVALSGGVRRGELGGALPARHELRRHARRPQRLAGRLAALEQRITCLETHCESLAVEVENAAFMSKHNAEVASVLCERVGWSLEHEPLAAPK